MKNIEKEIIDLDIVIPAKNEGNHPKNSYEFLRVALESIRTQDVQPKHIFIADANYYSPEDNTKQITEEYGAIHIPGGNPPTARNNGADAGENPAYIGDTEPSKVILWKDADNYFPDKSFLRTTYNERSQRKLDIMGVYHQPISTGKLGKDIFDFFFYNILSNGSMWLAQWTYKPGMQTCMLATREAYNKLKGFRTDLEFREDSDFAIRGKKQNLRFRMAKKPRRINVSPRRLEGQRFKMLARYLSWNIQGLFGKEFLVENSRYFE